MARRRLLLVAMMALAAVSSSIFLAVGAAAEPGEVVPAAPEPKVEVESKKVDVALPSPAPAPAAPAAPPPAAPAPSKAERDLAKIDASLTKAYDKTKDGVEDAYKKVKKDRGVGKIDIRLAAR